MRVALKILQTAGHGMSADEVLPAFREHRAVTRGALVNVLVSMTRIGLIVDHEWYNPHIRQL